MPTFPTYHGELPSILSPWNLKHHWLIVYWILFRPAALKCYLYKANSEIYLTNGGLNNLIVSFKSPAYRGLYITALFLILSLSVSVVVSSFLVRNLGILSLSPLICKSMLVSTLKDVYSCMLAEKIWQYPTVFFHWKKWFIDIFILNNLPKHIFFALITSLISGALISIFVILLNGIVLGIISGLASSILLSSFLSIGLNGSVVSNTLGGISIGILANLISSELSILAGITTVVLSSLFGILVNYNLASITTNIAIIIGFFRIPFYIWQDFSAIIYRGNSHGLEWDELSILPLRGSAHFLKEQLKKNEEVGIKLLSQQINNVFQRWTAQKSLYLHLHSIDQHSALSFFYKGMQHPTLNEYVGFPRNARQQRFAISTGQILISEIAVLKPIDREGDEGILASLTYNLTKPLRILKPTPITKFARLIYILNYKLTAKSPIELSKWQALYRELTDYPYGQEIIQSLDTISVFLDYQTIADLATAHQELRWISLIALKDPHPPTPSPKAGEGEPEHKAKSLAPSPLVGEGWGEGYPTDYLRPTVISALQTLGEIGIKARTYLASTTKVNKLSAIARAIDTIQQLSQTIESSPKLPETVLLQRIILQWEELLISAGGAEGRLADLKPVANPYVVGNPVTGQLFVGRDDIMRRFEELWNAPGQLPSIVLYGHRRMGKTSILRNLPDRFGRDQIIDFNMQRVGYVESTGELFYNLALAIYDTLLPNTITEPTKNEYLQENPFTAFDRGFLKKLNPRPHNQRLIIAIDEFEIIEELIQTGKIEAKFLDFFRSLIQTYPWFILVFAGLHTLQEMTEDYWSPLFGNTSLIPVSFLNPKAAAQLITNPSPDFSIDYDQEAIELIYTLTNGQPYLVQLICHNLVSYYNNQRFEDNLDRPARFTTQDVEAIIAVPEFYRDGNAYFTGVWEQSKETHGQDQIQILQTLCTNPLSINQLATETNQNPEQLQAALNTLIDHDVIYLQDHQYIYKVELMRRWVATQKF